MVEEIIMSSDRSYVSADLQFVPKYDVFDFRFDYLGVVDLGLPFTDMSILLFLPEGTNTSVNGVFCFTSWDRSACNCV